MTTHMTTQYVPRCSGDSQHQHVSNVAACLLLLLLLLLLFTHSLLHVDCALLRH
jgi:hypothetical protein